MDFDIIYWENADIVYRYLFSLCCDAHWAEEVTPQAFCEAIRSTAGESIWNGFHITGKV